MVPMIFLMRMVMVGMNLIERVRVLQFIECVYAYYSYCSKVEEEQKILRLRNMYM